MCRDIVEKDISTAAEVVFALFSVTGLKVSNKHLVVRKQEELTKVLIFNRACFPSFFPSQNFFQTLISVKVKSYFKSHLQ